MSNSDDVRRATDDDDKCRHRPRRNRTRGHSACGALALEAAAAGLPVTKVGAFEVPYDVYPGAQERHSTYCKELGALLAEDRREAAFELFMRLAGTPEEMIGQAPSSPRGGD